MPPVNPFYPSVAPRDKDHVLFSSSFAAAVLFIVGRRLVKCGGWSQLTALTLILLFAHHVTAAVFCCWKEQNPFRSSTWNLEHNKKNQFGLQKVEGKYCPYSGCSGEANSSSVDIACASDCGKCTEDRTRSISGTRDDSQSCSRLLIDVIWRDRISPGTLCLVLSLAWQGSVTLPSTHWLGVCYLVL